MTEVREVMRADLVTVEPTATLAEAATVMGAHGTGSVLVLDDGVLAGIFTERDVVRALGSHFDAAAHPVVDWMTRDPVTIGPETSLAEARELMLTRGFRHLPVLEGGALVGIISIRDVTRADDGA